MSDPRVLESPEEVLSTLHSDGRRRWLYPVPSHGKFWKARFVVAWVLIAFFVGMPLVKIGGKPAIFLDIMHREFTFFGLTLYATDTLLYMFAMIIGVFSVIVVTAVFGRVWCGWGCPQTVYLEFVFRPIERLIEGKENQRRRRDEAGSSFDKTWRKTLKFIIYSILSVGLAHTFVAYFVSWDSLIEWMTGPPAEHWGFFVMMAITSALILFDFGYFREQMCTIACPYARIQSVLQDEDSMIVSYDPNRGEPRGKRSKAQYTQEREGVKLNLGDCINCFACVRTCPTGIDIRDGLQMECVGCTQCMDACDAIMISIAKPVGLIRYTSENALENKPSKILRPRTMLYAVVFVLLSSAFFWLLFHREPIDLNVTRAATDPYVMVGDKVMNQLKFRVQNRTGQDGEFRFIIPEPPGVEIKLQGLTSLQIEDGKTERIGAFILVPKEAFQKGSVKTRIQVTDGQEVAEFPYTLIGP